MRDENGHKIKELEHKLEHGLSGLIRLQHEANRTAQEQSKLLAEQLEAQRYMMALLVDLLSQSADPYQKGGQECERTKSGNKAKGANDGLA
jgi:hypothetical protein